MTRCARRGSVVLVVAVTIIGVALVGTAAVVGARDGLARAYTADRRAESLAAAWSGVEIVRASIASQRDELIGGASLEIEGPWTVYSADGERVVVRLVAFDDDETVRPEAAFVNANAADAEVLGSIEGVASDAAGAIVRGRGGGYGSLAEVALAAGGRELDGVGVHAYEPEVACGVESDEERGRERVVLSGTWDESLEADIARTWGDEAVPLVKSIRDAGNPLASRREVIEAMEAFGLPPEEWAVTLDRIGFSDGPVVGRVDVNRASAAVLAALPGIDRAAGDAIVDARRGLSERSRRSPVWLVMQGVLSPEEFAAAADALTTRSLQWRVRVEAGFQAVGGSTGGSNDPGEGALARATVLEAVIDAAADPVRVAFVRELTGQGAWEIVRRRVTETSEQDAEGEEAEPETDGASDARRARAGVVSPGGDAGGDDEPGPSGIRVGRWFVAGGGS